MGLFQKSVIDKYLKDIDKNIIEKSYEKFKITFCNAEVINNIVASKEEQYQEGFLRELFVNCLGYTINPNSEYNLTTEYKNVSDARKADGAILKNGKPVGVIELKGTDTLDLKTVEKQAFEYRYAHETCKYIITSNFKELRFYINTYEAYEEFTIFHMEYKDFERFYLLLSKESIFTDKPEIIKADSKLKDEDISNKLYKDYHRFKMNIFHSIVKNNPDINKIDVLKKSQKLLDRILFILFAEDRGLLPTNTISQIISENKSQSDIGRGEPLYSTFKIYFNYIDKGNPKLKISEYNGGLFSPDNLLDNLIVEDNVLKEDSLLLSSYDFSTEIDVNILGHIFENSLNDIDELHAELTGIKFDKTKTRRKKDGVFYTPNYITKNVLENTLGVLCEEKKKELNLIDINLDVSIDHTKLATEKKNRKLSKVKQDLLENLHKYREFLISLKILDPACGSGAFLNQALEYLIEEHRFIDLYRKPLMGDLLGFFDVSTSILENNLYGVDVNEESVELARLSLWLRTAERGRKLNDLSKNIQCGNSLIDDKNIASDLAFNWNDRFPEIMNNGGFDIVIGNPPYVDTKSIEKDKVEYYKTNYICAGNRVNTFALFIERAYEILKPSGKFGMIIHRNLIRSNDYVKCRKYILNNSNINYILCFGIGVFEDVTGEMMVLISTKHFNKNNTINVYNYENNIDVSIKPKQIKQEIFSESIGKRFNIFLTDQIIIILKKINNNSIKCGEIANTYQGIIAKDESIDILNKKIENNYMPIIRGKSIQKYSNLVSNEYINYSEGSKYLTRGRVKSIFELEEKIVTQHVSGKIIATLDTNKYYYMQTVNGTNVKDVNYSNKYLLTLFNSKLINFYYEFVFNLGSEFTTAVAIDNIDLLPIKSILFTEQSSFIEKADNMLLLNRNLQEKKFQFIEWLKSEFALIEISNKLDSFYDLDFDEMKIELKKKMPKGKELDPENIGKLKKYYDDYKNQLLDLKSKINKTDSEIDTMVYQVYNLSPEDIEIIESTSKKK